jgi:hypothetical protein
MGEGNENLVYPSAWDFKSSFTCRKILRHGTFRLYFPSERKVCCGFLSPLKIHLLDRVRTRKLWVQWQTLTTAPARRRERRYSCYSFSTLGLDGEWPASRPGRTISPGKTPGTDWTGGWVGPRAGLDSEDRGRILPHLPGIEPRSPGQARARHYSD